MRNLHCILYCVLCLIADNAEMVIHPDRISEYLVFTVKYLYTTNQIGYRKTTMIIQ